MIGASTPESKELGVEKYTAILPVWWFGQGMDA